MLHVSVLLTGFHQAYEQKSAAQNYMHIEYVSLRAQKFYSLVFSFCFIKWRMFSFTRQKLKYFCKIGCIRKAVPLVKIFNAFVGGHGNLGISLV